MYNVAISPYMSQTDHDMTVYNCTFSNMNQTDSYPDYVHYPVRLALEAGPAAGGEGEGDDKGKDKKAVLNDLLDADVEISPEQALAAVL